jgi:uroporphyrinogen III methyltransferase/synthase
MNKKGKVYLVGAGVGNVAYLTVKAKELLSVAEVLIYDALVGDEILDLVPEDCLKLDVGKRGGKVSTPQDKIDRALVTYCCQGKRVVRLKSGDPLIFGRAMEEIKALQAARCDFELVPGISSVLAAPLLAGIPLTDKHLSSCFAVFTGHQPDSLNWDALAGIDTLVILMGTRSLSTIINNLINVGRSPDEAIAIVHNCSQPGQKVFRGTLTDIVKKTEGITLSPAVIIIGEVVANNFIPSTNSVANLPLTGKTVLVTRAAGQSSKFATLLQKQGATVLEMPALTITAPSNWNDLDNAIALLASFDWLILTSANGVNYFLSRLKALGEDIRTLARIKIAVVGKKTAAVLQEYNLQPDFIPPDYVADSLIETFPENLAQQKILFPRVETGGRDVLVRELKAQGADIVEVAAYQSQCPKTIEPQIWQALQQKQIDIITFASSKTVRNFVQLVTAKIDKATDINILLQGVAIASIGPQTSQTCHDLLHRVDIEATQYTLEGLTEAIISNQQPTTNNEQRATNN